MIQAGPVAQGGAQGSWEGGAVNPVVTMPPAPPSWVEPDDQSSDSQWVEAEAEDDFYGSRWIEVETAEGRTFKEVPLTLEDLLNPQEGDQVTQTPDHGNALSETKESLRCFLATKDHDFVIWDDVLMKWKDPTIPQAAPDIAVIPGIKEEKNQRSSFDEEQEGTCPIFIMETLSKHTADIDRKEKPLIYHSAKVKEYFLLDPLKEQWELTGYRLVPGWTEYKEIQPDGRGRLLAETLGVRFSIAPAGNDLIAEEAATGEPLRKPIEESMARQAAESRASKEAEARQAAESRASEEAEARQAAESRASEEAEARKAAERQASEEAKARQTTEAEPQKLLAEVERLRVSQAS